MSETEIRNKNYINIEEWNNESIFQATWTVSTRLLMFNNYSKEEALKLLHQSSGNLHNIL